MGSAGLGQGLGSVYLIYAMTAADAVSCCSGCTVFLL